MRSVVVVAAWFFASASLPSHAAPAEPKAGGCFQAAMTQPELDMCAGGLAQQADAHLNRAYRDILRYVDGDDRTKLVAGQRAWLAFRDADCDFFGAGGGTIAPMNMALCRADLSETRAKELENWPPNAPRSALIPMR